MQRGFAPLHAPIGGIGEAKLACDAWTSPTPWQRRVATASNSRQKGGAPYGVGGLDVLYFGERWCAVKCPNSQPEPRVPSGHSSPGLCQRKRKAAIQAQGTETGVETPPAKGFVREQQFPVMILLARRCEVRQRREPVNQWLRPDGDLGGLHSY